MSRVWTLLAALALAGCSSDMSDLESFVADVKSRKSRAIEPIPQMKQYEAFVYIPNERRDPFEPTQPTRETGVVGGGSGVQPDFNRNKEPLEEFPIDGLRMIGTITLKERWYALVKAPDGVVHRVSRGDHIGQNFGKIQDISETEMRLMEIISDGFGGWMQRPAVVALAQ